MDSICNVCLSSERHLRSVDLTDTFKKTLHEIYKNRDGSVIAICWECEAVLNKVRRFISQAKVASVYLKKALFCNEVKPQSILSSLAVQTKDGFDCVFEHGSVRIKSEFVEGAEPFDYERPEVGNSQVEFDFSVEEKNVSRDENYSADLCKTATLEDYVSSDEETLAEKLKQKTKGAGEVSCPVCECRFHTAGELARHGRRHYALYVCKACPFRHRDNVAMRRHYDIQHDFSKSFTCAKCGETFLNYYNLNYHRETKHRDSTCAHCGKTVGTRANLKRHILRMHSSTLPMLECATCNKKFRGEASLRAHTLTHASAPDPLAYCAKCNKQFKTFAIYREHLKKAKRHLDPDRLRYKCNECDKRFFLKSQMNSHYDLIHLKKTKWKCDVCQKYFLGGSQLRLHTKRVHLKLPVESKEVCNICSKKFKTKQRLADHVRTHTGERPFRCRVCDATFGHHAALWTHNKLVHKAVKRTSA